MNKAVRFASSFGLLLGSQIIAPRENKKKRMGDILPGAKNIHTAGVSAGLGQSHKEANGCKLGVVVACSATDCQAAPKNDHGRQPYPRRDLLDGESIGDLANH